MVASRKPGHFDQATDWRELGGFVTPGRRPTPLPGILGGLIYPHRVANIILALKVQSLLRSSAAGRVNFKIGNATVNKSTMEKVAQAIDNEMVVVEAGDSGEDLEASYHSKKTRKPKPWQKRITGIIVVKQQAISSKTGKAHIFHECVHALKDVCNYKLQSMQQDEALAYVAEAIYMAHEQIEFETGNELEALFKELEALIKKHKMLERPGTALQWTDCDKVIAAVKAIPVYSGAMPSH